MQKTKNKNENVKFRAFLGSLFFASALISLPGWAVDLTCTNAIGGAWNFGTAPKSCNVSPLVVTSETKSQYGPVLFSDAQLTANARQQYMSSMYPVLRDVGRYYIQRRNPGVSALEMKSFVEGLFVLAHQETFWSHYRNGTDGIIRYMRGDNLHGHGLMQVDDRSHAAALKAGKGVDLIYNMIYGLDIFYASWVKSSSASCISSPTDYVNRTRAAWAAYNGGPGAICRWKTKNTAGDQQFLAKYNSKAWMGYVSNPQAPVSVNIKCLTEGIRPCLPAGNPTPVETPKPPVAVYQVGDFVEVVAVQGINLRGLLDGKIISRVPRGAQVRVDQLKIQGTDSEVYVRTHFQGADGYLYGGHLLPEKTFHQWLISAVPVLEAKAVLKSTRAYGFLRQCPSATCEKVAPLIRSFGSAPLLQIVKREGPWIYVKSPELEEQGWIATNDVEEVHY